MKRLFLVLVLLCSVAMSYAQVLNDVKPLGIPLGIDEATALKMLKDRGAVLDRKSSNKERLLFDWKTGFEAVTIEYVVLGLFEGKVMSLTVFTTTDVYEKLRQTFSRKHGTPIEDGESAEELTSWSILCGAEKGAIAQLNLEHNPKAGFVSANYQHLSLVSKYIDAAFAEL